MKKLFLLFLVIISVNSHAQVILSSTIQNLKGEPLPYANIMIQNQPYGTSSNIYGFFEISIPYSLLNDTIIISSVGYESKKMGLSELKEKTYLSAQIIMLPEIIISSSIKEDKTIILNKFKKRNCFMRHQPDYRVDSTSYLPYRQDQPNIEAIYFPENLKYQGKRIKEVWIYTTSYSVPSYFRLRIFSSSSHLPAHDMLIESRIIEVKSPYELVKIKLEESIIYYPSNGLFIGMEVLIIPDNKCDMVVKDQHIPIYSPFMNFTKAKNKMEYWIYANGDWQYREHISEGIYFNKSKKDYNPAISLILSN